MTHRLLVLLCLLPVAPLFAAGGGKGNPIGPNGASPSPTADQFNKPLSSGELKISPRSIFHRVIQARVYHLGTWTLEDPSQTPVTAARTIASLRPSFVTGLLRISDRGIPSNAETEAFLSIRNTVQSSVKGSRFDVLIDADNDASGSVFLRRMSEIATRIHPDAWTFYIPPDSTSINPEALAEGIAYAHSHGELVGYDGPLSLIPEGVDYIVVRAWNLEVNREQLERLADRHVPLLVELPTTFGNKEHPDCTKYLTEMDGSEKGELLSRLAADQSRFGYHFAYPLFYPLKDSHKAFDATKDSILMVTIRSLLARFN